MNVCYNICGTQFIVINYNMLNINSIVPNTYFSLKNVISLFLMSHVIINRRKRQYYVPYKVLVCYITKKYEIVLKAIRIFFEEYFVFIFKL